MEENKESSSNDVHVLDVTDYFSWRSKMKAYLKKFGVWEIVINPPSPSNKKGKSVAQKEAKKDNTTALKFLMDGLPSSVKDSVGEFTSAKDYGSSWRVSIRRQDQNPKRQIRNQKTSPQKS